jgi:N-acetylneuraminic acid mutarotase
MRKLRNITRHICGPLLALGLIIGATLAPELASAQTVTPSWTLTGDLNTARYAHTATLLPNGKVLVAGGVGPNSCSTSNSTAELYDPITGTWSHTGSLNTARISHTATLLQNGQVLVAGGHALAGGYAVFLNSAELYDPATGMWRPTGSFNTIKNGGSATLLPNGKVLIVGSDLNNRLVAELYDPATGTWSSTGAPSLPWGGHSVLLPNGKVLAVWVGSHWDNYYGELFAELYDPATGQWSATGSVNSMHFADTVTLLRNGKVLVTGDGTQSQLYDTTTGTWSITGSLNTSRYNYYTATLQADGRVLVAGGNVNNGFVSQAELYDPTVGTWSSISRVIVPRLSHTGTLLRNGKTLIVGGADAAFLNGCDASILLSAELYDPGITSTPNPIDDPQFFVRQHYLDFLNREPDQAGLAFWTNEITSCGTDQQCIEIKRINVSAAFFLSIEFQETGYLLYRMYKAAYGDMPGAPVPLTRQEFLPDTQQIGQGIVVGTPGWEQQLENNKYSFASEFVSRSRFTTAFPQGMTPEQFVDALNSNAGGVLSQGERDQLVSELASGAKTRAQVLRSVAEDTDLARNEFNKAFVLMQYFGYLRRNPSDAPDTNFAGYDFWLNKLNLFGGNFVNAEMVKAFITSIEYRNRIDSCLGCWDY